jgi:hypothetical protein
MNMNALPMRDIPEYSPLTERPGTLAPRASTAGSAATCSTEMRAEDDLAAEARFSQTRSAAGVAEP